ncbi:MAG TPA: lytic murein transglycosylase [Vicinamibacterales bacterium]|nr:lytic murein transglycosylase [Vicinamibacterales bacterium]
MRLFAVVLLAVAGASLASQSPAPPPRLPAVQMTAPVLQTFGEWIAGVRAEAIARGISQATVDAALTGLQPQPTVIQRDRTQAEVVLTLDEYIARRLTPKMVRTAREASRAHRTLLRKVEAAYHVPARVIVAIWGMESNFGRFSGVRPTIQALATLAYDPRRATLFREELFDALTILDHGDIALAAMRGSWAGAMGQPQFMPSSFLTYARDFDGDGRRDIWSSEADVFASIAYYLSQSGWTPPYTWGREVKVPRSAVRKVRAAAPLRTRGCAAEQEMTVPLPLKRWRALGVTRSNGQPLPSARLEASLVRGQRRMFLVYPNYDALLAYNCAHAYGITVGLLSDRVR